MIRDDVDSALRRGVADAYTHGSGTPTEPELVASVFSAGLPDPANRLRTTAPSTRLAGVFCHSRPMATKPRDPSWKCEIGDLLVVSRYDDGTTVERSALLLQVKKPPIGFATSGTAARQVELYEYWPRVKVFGTNRDVANPPHRGAQFSFWNVCATADSPCASCSWDDRIPGNPPFNEALADELAAVIAATGGRAFVEYGKVASSGDDWSGLIWDLLKQSLNHAWSVARRAQSGGSRTWNDGVFLVTGSPQIPELIAETELADVARELWFALDTRSIQDGPPLNPHLPSAPEVSDAGGIPIIFTESAGRPQRHIE